nr:mediator of rna polymerase ii transcription subunit 13 [Quercus suber]
MFFLKIDASLRLECGEGSQRRPFYAESPHRACLELTHQIRPPQVSCLYVSSSSHALAPGPRAVSHPRRLSPTVSCSLTEPRINREPRAVTIASYLEEDDGQRIMFDVLKEMRAREVLCASKGHDLWIFLSAETSEPTVSELLALLCSSDYCFSFEDSTSIGAERDRTEAGDRALHDKFLEAVEAALAFDLAKDNGCFRVAPWSWVVCGPAGESSHALSLNASISSTGVFHATATTWELELEITAMDGSESNTSLVLAVLSPGGHAVSLVQQDESTNARENIWKEIVASRLRASGTLINDNDAWLRVRLKTSANANDFFWPAKLLLSISPLSRLLNIGSKHYFQHWFDSAGDAEGYENPFGEIQSWVTEIQEHSRDDMLVDEDHVLLHVTDTDGEMGSTDVDTLLETSPPFSQRSADHQAAMVGIYPTPPDGLAPGHPQSQHPGQDNMAALALTDSSAAGNDLLANTDIQHESDQSLDSLNALSTSFQHNADDLFGDIGEMDDFTREEVGDADFSFFDEPDDLGLSDLQTDLEMPEAPREVSAADDDERPADLVPHSSATLPASESHDFATVAISDDNTSLQHAGTASTGKSVEAHHLSRPVFVSETIPNSEVEKPLSPFGIRERLLPPPIPASAQRHSIPPTSKVRRSTNFDPVIFKEGLESTFKYTQRRDHTKCTDMSLSVTEPDISLPLQRRKTQIKRNKDFDSVTLSNDEESESEDDSYGTNSIPSVADYSPKLPWASRKRKRDVQEGSMLFVANEFGSKWSDDNDNGRTAQQSLALLELLLGVAANTTPGVVRSQRNWQSDIYAELATHAGSSLPLEDELQPAEASLGLGKLDLVYVAQLVCEQALGCSSALSQSTAPYNRRHELGPEGCSSYFQARTGDIISQFFPAAENCDVLGIALAMERNSSGVQVRAGQPRLSQRTDTSAVGPEIIVLPAPFVRVRRGQESYEMLAPALDFWEPLSLGPSSGNKNVKAFCVLPSNAALQTGLRNFVDELGSVYESCKLGTHQHGSLAVNDSSTIDVEGSLVLVNTDNARSPRSILEAYSSVCLILGTLLSAVSHADIGQTFVVYMIDPFNNSRASQTLCACFWVLYKAYRESMRKRHRGQPCCDIVLQILPISLIAQPHSLAIMSRSEMAALAKEVYDRCPPSTDTQKADNQPEYAVSAPYVELAPLLPRKIQFQLATDPPSDLLHEGSVLHMAYAVSEDQQWISVHWINGTGSYERTSAFPIRGRSHAEVIEEVWDQTGQCMTMRAVMWRVFILASDASIDNSTQQCWRKVVAGRPRNQMLSVTLLTSQTHLPITVMPPTSLLESSANGQTTAFPTPVTTPSGTVLTASPDTNPHASAPLTPAPSESVGPAEPDPDAYLVEASDETFGMLFAAPYTSRSALASGALFKRGSNYSGESDGEPLPSLGVSVLWTVHVRPTGLVDEGNVKHAEMTLKDVLRMYRGLAVLTKARGLVIREHDATRPIHLIAVMRAAHALTGLLR